MTSSDSHPHRHFTFSLPLPSTHAHTQKHHSHQHSSSSSTDSNPQPIQHTQSLPVPGPLNPQSHKHYRPHTSTPHSSQHPHTTNPLSHLDAHLPHLHPQASLTQHIQEYKLQHSFRHAKRDASLSLSSSSSPMPDLSSLPLAESVTVTEAEITEEPASDTMTDEDRQAQRARDQAAWEAVLKAREAAARRSTWDGQERPSMAELEAMKMSEGSVRTVGSRD